MLRLRIDPRFVTKYHLGSNSAADTVPPVQLCHRSDWGSRPGLCKTEWRQIFRGLPHHRRRKLQYTTQPDLPSQQHSRSVETSLLLGYHRWCWRHWRHCWFLDLQKPRCTRIQVSSSPPLLCKGADKVSCARMLISWQARAVHLHNSCLHDVSLCLHDDNLFLRSK